MVHEIAGVFGLGVSSEVALRADHGEVNRGREPHLDHVLVNRGARSNAGVEALFHDVDLAVLHLDLDAHFGVATSVLREQRR